MNFRPAALLLLPLALSACGLTDKENPPPCPQIAILADAAKVTKFRDGPGRDITDIAYEAEMEGFAGSCGYNKPRTEVDVSLQVRMTVTKGAAGGAKMAIPYFVALPDKAKENFAARVEFAGNATKVGYVDDEVAITIPLKDNEWGDSYTIFIGFQLTPEQLEFNRTRKR